MSNSGKARKMHLCPVCGEEDYMYKLPIRTEPDMPVCSGCIEKIVSVVGRYGYETGCEDCPYFQGYDLDLGCACPTFDLTTIGYDPDVEYVKPYQMALLPGEDSV